MPVHLVTLLVLEVLRKVEIEWLVITVGPRPKAEAALVLHGGLQALRLWLPRMVSGLLLLGVFVLLKIRIPADRVDGLVSWRLQRAVGISGLLLAITDECGDLEVGRVSPTLLSAHLAGAQ